MCVNAWARCGRFCGWIMDSEWMGVGQRDGSRRDDGWEFVTGWRDGWLDGGGGGGGVERGRRGNGAP